MSRRPQCIRKGTHHKVLEVLRPPSHIQDGYAPAAVLTTHRGQATLNGHTYHGASNYIYYCPLYLNLPLNLQLYISVQDNHFRPTYKPLNVLMSYPPPIPTYMALLSTLGYRFVSRSCGQIHRLSKVACVCKENEVGFAYQHLQLIWICNPLREFYWL